MNAKRMKRLNEHGEVEETRPFDLAPDDFIFYIKDRWLPRIQLDAQVNQELRNPPFHTRNYSLIPYLEDEAIEALAGLFPEFPQQAARAPKPEQQGDFDEHWRSMWAREAWYQVRFDHPRAVSAALGILTAASQLRGAVEAGDAEKAAAFAMLVAFEAMRGGYGLELHALKESNSTLKKAKELAYQKGVGQINTEHERARASCIRWAANAWAADPRKRMGEVVAKCQAELQKEVDNLRTGKVEKPHTADTIRSWLIEASKEGRLVIPPDAQRPGAPKRKPK